MSGDVVRSGMLPRSLVEGSVLISMMSVSGVLSWSWSGSSKLHAMGSSASVTMSADFAQYGEIQRDICMVFQGSNGRKMER